MLQGNRMNMMDVNVIRNIRERDMGSTNFATGFKTRRGVTWRTVRADEVGRPDLISLRAYGTVNLWWIIMKLNGIVDPRIDLVPGAQIAIPSRLDISDYMKDYKK